MATRYNFLGQDIAIGTYFGRLWQNGGGNTGVLAEGSAFTIHPGRVVTDCAEYSGSTSGYLRVEVLCDYCTGEKVDKILDLVEKYCNDECMACIAYC